MSSMIKCDKCGKLMYTDSRSGKGAYAKFSQDYIDGYGTFHLCKICFRQFHVEFMRDWTPEEFDDQYGGIDSE